VTKTAVIIVAAGRGVRAGEGVPKQYRSLGGKPLLRRTIEAIQKSMPLTSIQVVIGPEDETAYNRAIEGITLLEPVTGGATRQISVFNGLKAVEAFSPDFVLIHDAARPFVSETITKNVTAALRQGAKAVVPAVPIVDTLCRVDGKYIDGPVDRTNLFSLQTPQGFNFKDLLAAHSAENTNDFTDDGTIMEAAGHVVEICEGEASNFKLTSPSDFEKAEVQLMQKFGDIRNGSGFDVHRFEAGDFIWLCGVKIPFTKGLKGHSDADVGLHALTDALLASVAAGDIGTHFPPSEAKWRGATSDIFIAKAVKIICEMGGVVANVTVCLICEEPKIGPYNAAMRDRISKLLGVSADRVSIQATTTEELGFTGRKEGIAAQATATIRLPWQRD